MFFQRIKKPLVYFLIVCTQSAPFSAAFSQTLPAIPPNIASTAAKPMLMLAASKDHTLFSPIYSDFEDLDNDGVIETTFKPAFKYYGYFDATKCYSYSGADGRFEPKATATITNDLRYTCSTAQKYWSGNFLNWSTMTRIDTVRKMLYGGRRSTDSTSETVLERANLSKDAHSFTKFYSGTDINDYTPFTTANLTKTTGDNSGTFAGLTICNRSDADTDVGTPVMRMAIGNYRMWATIEDKVCVWQTGENAELSQVKLGAKLARYYGNAQPFYGGGSIRHESQLPVSSSDGASYVSGGTIGPEINVRVKVCDADFLGDERCQKFPQRPTGTSTVTTYIYKPYGLLQDFGFVGPGQSSAKAEFGLITGSYDKNLTAGALRKNMGDFKNEIDAATGRFCHTASSQLTTGTSGACTAEGAGTGAIAALDRIVLYGRNGGYVGGASLAANLNEGALPAWGNPIGEMVVQALNYYAGNNSTNPGTTTNDNNKGISVTTWTNPLTYTDETRISNYGKAACRSLNVLALSSSALSFDQAADTPFTNLPNRAIDTLANYVNRVGSAEGINNTSRAVGTIASGFGQNCSAKGVANLSDVSGVCPEAPSVGGSFQVAGAALYGNTSKMQNITLPTDAPYSALTVQTMAASLGGGVARIEVPIPNTNPRQFVYITPEGLWGGGPASMLTFSSISSSSSHGAFLVTWNDSLFGGDHDMDLTGYLRYDIIAPTAAGNDYKIKITSDIVNAGSGADSGTHGYSVVGVNKPTASSTSLAATDSADGVYLTHGHSRASSNGNTAVMTAGTMCANTDYRATGQANGGTYTVATFPNHVATRAQVGGTGDVYNACWNSIDNWTLRDVDLPTVGTFVMRGAGNVLLNDPLWYAAKYGSYDSRKAPGFTTASNSTSTLATVAWDARRADGSSCGGSTGVSCNDGVPDGYFLARRPELLERQLRDQLEQIVASSNAAPAVSSSQLINGSFKYTAKFDTTLKKGSIEAFRIDAAGDFPAQPSWDAGELLRQLPVASRQIITNNDQQIGVTFQWSSLDATYTTALKGTSSTTLDTRAQNLISYMRGDSSNEEPNGEKFQARSVSNLLGTIVNSTPWIQSRPSAKYLDYFFPSTAPKYSDFSSAQNSRNELLWTGSNDGMVHGFSSQTGAPVLSYVPRPLVPMLKTLVTTGTSTAIVASMDGSPFTGDVLATDTTSGSTTWKTYLFSSLGRGGKGVFALDVTGTGNPTSSPAVASSLTQTNAASIFKWQFTNADDTDLGYVVGDPLPSQFSGQASPIMLLNNGQFAILTPNGINSAGGKAALFILGVDGPGADNVWGSTVDTSQTPRKAEYYRLGTLATDTNNGMMGATWVDIDGNGTADYVYATDLKGNVWKFDIRSNNPSNWSSAFTTTGGVNKPFYTALSPTGAALPITTSPALGFPPDGGIMVTFGSGKALETTDFPTSATNRMFGIFDRTGVNGTDTVVLATGTNTLLQRVYTEIATGTATGSMISSATPTLDLSVKDGWYFDFPRASEQVLSNPDVKSKNIAFTTVRRANTSANQCFYTPPGQQYFINPNTGLPSGPTLGTYVDPITNITYNLAAIPSNDQKVRIINDRSGRINGSSGSGSGGVGGTSGACPANSFGYRIVGQNSDKTLCIPTSTSRIQWREVPGLKTRIR